MKQKKIKLFLGGYINSTNAQNLNCLALAEHLDKNKFEVFTLNLYSGNLEPLEIPGVKVFNCFKPFKISKYLGYLWGIWNCDIAYLPKREVINWTTFLIKVLRKKSFSTVEGIFDKEALESAIKTHGSSEKVIQSFGVFTKLFSITKFLNDYNFKHHNIVTEDTTLYLGTNTAGFLYEEIHATSLRKVLIIGNDLLRKGIFDFLELATQFPSLKFYIVGSGNGKIDVQQVIEDKQHNNVVYLGTLSSSELANELKTMDLHILPSRSEGFPKVTLETAAAGVPSMVYSDYGASEWITHNQNGFVVDTLDDMIAVIQELIESPSFLKLTSKNAIALAKQFDWSILIKKWEEEILKLANN